VKVGSERAATSSTSGFKSPPGLYREVCEREAVGSSGKRVRVPQQRRRHLAEKVQILPLTLPRPARESRVPRTHRSRERVGLYNDGHKIAGGGCPVE